MERALSFSIGYVGSVCRCGCRCWGGGVGGGVMEKEGEDECW